MAAPGVILSHDVEEEWLDSEVECLVLQEQLGHETQALAVDLVFLSVNLEDRRLPAAVDLPARGVTPRTQSLQNTTSS